MHPGARCLRNRRQRGEIITGTQVQIPGVEHHDGRRIRRFCQSGAQRICPHLPWPAPGQRHDGAGAQPQQPQRPVHAGMALRIGQHANGRGAGQPLHFHIPTLGGQHLVAGGGKRGGVAHLAAGGEAVSAAFRQVQRLQQQGAGHFFQHGAGRAGAGQHDILVPQSGQHIGGMRRRQGTALHPGKEAPAQIAHQPRLRRGGDQLHHRFRRHAAGGQGGGERRQHGGAAAGGGDRAAGLAVHKAATMRQRDIKRCHNAGR